MSITIKEIAELSKTSRGTVDRVLNGRGRVSKEKSELILEIAEKYGYKVNRAARELVNSKKEYKIGVIINAVGNDFYQRVLNGITEIEKQDKSRQFKFYYYTNKPYDKEGQLANLEKVINQDVDGLIITPVVSSEVIDALNSLTIPIVTSVHDLNLEKDDFFFVGCNYESNGQLAADLANALVSDNNILIVSGPKHIDSYIKRNNGFKRRINDNKNIEIVYTEDNDDSTYHLVKDVLEKGLKPGLFYFNTYGIKGGLKAIREKELSPKVISVDETDGVIEGLNNDEIAVTITQQPEKQGVRSVEIMINLLLVKQEPPNSRTIIGNKIKVKSSNFNEIVWETNQ